MIDDVPVTFTEVFAAGLSLLHHIAFLTNKLQAPSGRSFDFVAEVVKDVLSDSSVLLLRWTTYLIWFRAVRSPLYNTQPSEADISKGYGPKAVHIAPLIISPNSPIAQVSSKSEWFKTVCYRRFATLETTLLFGPAVGMILPFTDDSLPGRFSGPFWAFYVHTQLYIAGLPEKQRTCADGTVIDFLNLSRVMEDRVRSIKINFDLSQPPLYAKPEPGIWHSRKGKRLEKMHRKILDMVKEIDFLALGDELHERVLKYMAAS